MSASSKEHVAAADVAAAASADEVARRGCGHFKRLKDTPFNDPGDVLLLSLQSAATTIASNSSHHMLV